MKIDNINNANRILHGGNSTEEHRRRCQNEDVYNNNRPAKAAALSGSERINGEDISFKGDPKLVQNIATDFLKGAKSDMPKWAEKMGSSKWFKNVLSVVNKHETLFENIVTLFVAGLLKPICVLAMPGAEKEDKQMAATKNAVSALVGFGISSVIMTPISGATNKILSSLDSAEPTKYIKDPLYVAALKSAEVAENGKSSLHEAFKSTFKKFPDVGIAPMKAAITIALTPIVLKKIFGKTKKSKKEIKNPTLQMPVMNLIKMDGKNNVNAVTKTSSKTSFKGDAQNKQINFTGNPIKTVSEKLSEPLAHGLGRLATTGPAKWIVGQTARFDKPVARWSDFGSIAITLFYMRNTWKSEKIDEDRKLPLMINNAMVTIASSAAAFLIDALTDKPMDNILKSYIKTHKKELNNKSIDHITETLKNLLNNQKLSKKEIAHEIELLTKNGGEMISNGVPTESGILKEAIRRLSENESVKSALSKGLISEAQIKEMAASGFSSQASKIYKNISKTKSLTIFAITVRFLVTVLMTPVIGKVVAWVNKKTGKDKNNQQKQDTSNIGMKDYLNSLKK